MIVARECGMSLAEVRQLDCATFIELVAIVQRLRRDVERDAWLRAAFIGWQVVSALGVKLAFRDYVKRLGLQELLDG